MRCPLGGMGSSPQEMTKKVTKCSVRHVLLLISKHMTKRDLSNLTQLGLMTITRVLTVTGVTLPWSSDSTGGVARST